MRADALVFFGREAKKGAVRGIWNYEKLAGPRLSLRYGQSEGRPGELPQCIPSIPKTRRIARSQSFSPHKAPWTPTQ
jgi:hypothetical protein